MQPTQRHKHKLLDSHIYHNTNTVKRTVQGDVWCTHSLQMSVKLTKEVFFVPTRTTWGGFMTNFLFSPATMSGFFSLMMLKTRLSSCWHTFTDDHEKGKTNTLKKNINTNTVDSVQNSSTVYNCKEKVSRLRIDSAAESESNILCILDHSICQQMQADKLSQMTALNATKHFKLNLSRIMWTIF